MICILELVEAEVLTLRGGTVGKTVTTFSEGDFGTFSLLDSSTKELYVPFIIQNF